MYGCESWTIKKVEHWRIDAFELWCWRRLWRVPWTARKSNQSILKEISPGCSLEGLMLKLKLQYFGHLMGRVDSLEKTLMLEGLGAGGEGDDRGWDGWMASPTRWAWVWVDSRSWWRTGRPGVLRFMGCKDSDMTERLNWTESKKDRQREGEGEKKEAELESWWEIALCSFLKFFWCYAATQKRASSGQGWYLIRQDTHLHAPCKAERILSELWL